ncbi:translation initiation factor IF-2 [Sulfurihydrogenibium subterraneum]|uniref:translation initiation factor IF-2 n=1 Tax=Sulfurihydrogenibium subterraneum TaxID=171121 RepID=UPI00048E29FE|nr:translation initiation factor IF-2 [Sulfurihydrogenibium subterraneum]
MKVKDLAIQLNIDPQELKKILVEEFGLNIKKISDKVDEDVIEVIKDRFAQKEEKVEKKEKEKEEGIKAFDLYHKLGITLAELEQKLRDLGYTKEVSNLSIIPFELAKSVEEKVKEEKRKIEEELKKLEEEKRKKLEEEKKAEEEKIKEQLVAIEEKPEEKVEIKTQQEIKEEKVEPATKQPEVIEGVVPEEERKKVYRKEEKKPFERKERFEKREKFEKKEERRPFEKREKFEKKEEKKPFERKEKFEKREEKKPFEKREERPLRKAEERSTLAFTPESIKEEKKPEKKETKEERIARIAKEEKEEMEALRKLMEGHPKKKKPKKEEKKKEVEESKEEEIKIIQIPEVITVRELADLLNIPVNQILMDLLQKKILATVNQTIDPKIALEIAEKHGFLAELKVEGEEAEEEIKEEEIEIKEEAGELEERPPVVTVMGHVDHGKTTLLDTIRKTDVAAREHGGITQHIGAYKIKLPNGKEITFLDTPGHEAFTTLRARGSKVADIAVLVVAADDGVKPQTVEAINHAKNAKVPIIVAVNKIDKPGADPMRVRQELTQYGLIPEEWGGDTIFVDISAKTGKNVEELLEMILLVAEMLELKANPNKLAVGTVIESKLDPKKGPVATVLIEDGTLHVGDYFVAGYTWGKVKALFNERGERLKEAKPGTPVEVLGFDEVPQAGDKFISKATEREAKQLAEVRKLRREEELLAKKTRISLENLGEAKEINIIIKADVQGSLEALKKSVEDLSEKFDEVKINIIHAAVGGITESDVMLAAASNAIIIGFNVRPDAGARKLSEQENVDIRLYNIIYQAIEDLEKAMKGMLKPTLREVLLGTAEVRAIFKAKAIGTIAGCYVTEGVIKRNAKARLVRDGIVIYDGEISSLKRFKEDVKEVQKGFECGLTLKNYNDIKVGDIIEAYEIVEERPA